MRPCGLQEEREGEGAEGRRCRYTPICAERKGFPHSPLSSPPQPASPVINSARWPMH